MITLAGTSPRQHDSAGPADLRAEVDVLRAEVAQLRDQVTRVTFGHMLAAATAAEEGFERGRTSVSRPQPRRAERAGRRPGYLQLVADGEP